MQDARTRWAIAVFGLLTLGGSGAMLYEAHRAASPSIVITPPPPSNSVSAFRPSPAPPYNAAPSVAPAQVRHQKLHVDVSGAVRHPWLYALPAGSRVMQAIMAAGGPAAGADLNAVNLAEPVQDGEKVYIPAKHSLPHLQVADVPPGNTIGYRSVLPHPAASQAESPTLPVVIEPGTGTNSLPVSASGKKSKLHSSSSRADKITSPSQGQIDLNTADAAQLMRLPDVGPAMAARIISFRTQAQGFQSISELQEVGGIGPKKFAKISPLVTVGGQ